MSKSSFPLSRRRFLQVPLGLGAWMSVGRPALSRQSPSWRAGAAHVNITPRGPVWMAGYASRTSEGQGTLQPLSAKALAIEDPEGRRAVLITADVCGIPRAVGDTIAEALSRRHGLPRAAVLINLSHTHSGPFIEGLTPALREFDEGQWNRIVAYTRWFEEQLIAVADRALGDLGPATLSRGADQAEFAVNRRNNKEAEVPSLRAAGTLVGPVDHEVPVLVVRDAESRLKALVFGYACHTTTLGIMEWNGDYAGFAQAEIERRHPGSVALFAAGCGADINPLPRREIALARDYGHQLADAVDRALGRSLETVRGDLRTSFAELPLRYASLPTRDELQARLSDKSVYERLRARFLLGEWERAGGLAPEYPYPIQCWQLGALRWIALSGEPVVDYALRLKAELGPATWVMGYANDIMAYIPSERVLREGGYEGGGASVYFGRPSPWAPGLEDQIVRQVRALL